MKIKIQEVNTNEKGALIQIDTQIDGDDFIQIGTVVWKNTGIISTVALDDILSIDDKYNFFRPWFQNKEVKVIKTNLTSY